MPKLPCCLLAIAATPFFAIPVWAGNCEKLARYEAANASITKAESVTGQDGLPASCRVAATIRPTSDSEIRVELWVPETGWNGRLEGTGNGGFAGKISQPALAGGLRLGYAVVNTDMGLGTPAGSDASIFVNRPERWADWGYRATHEMTVLAKQLVASYYGKPAARSYFVGCSTGGEQALMEAQRFPDDYDGIAGGAAANNRTRVHTSILWNFAVMEANPAGYIPAAKLPALERAVIQACDASDGIRDGLIEDPRRCHFDPASCGAPGPMVTSA